MPGTMMTITETSDLLGLPLALVESRIRDGRLPIEMVNGEVRIDMIDAIRMMAEERERNQLMTEIYREHAEIGDNDER